VVSGMCVVGWRWRAGMGGLGGGGAGCTSVWESGTKHAFPPLSCCTAPVVTYCVALTASARIQPPLWLLLQGAAVGQSDSHACPVMSCHVMTPC
jgi:hypothetical protein